MAIITIVIGALGTVTEGLVKGLEDLKIREQAETNCIIEFGQNTEKSPGDLRRVTVRWKAIS